MAKIIHIALLALLLVSCGWVDIPLAITTPQVSPSRPPAIFSPTNPLVPSTTPAITIPTTSPTPAVAFTVTITPASTQEPVLEMDILGCNTSLDITHGMGEVTNAYPIIRNNTEKDWSNVCATLSASDEARLHPDKTACIASLPSGDQVALKLTVDTGFKQDTAIQVDMITAEGYKTSIKRSSCRDIGMPGWVPAKVGIIEPIQ